MRMFRKISETKNEVIYEYLCENYKLPYTGLVKIKKTPFCVSVEKTADGEWNEKKVISCAYTLAENKYPKSYTHTAV